MMRERVNSGHKSPSQSSSMGGIGGNSPANEREDIDDNMDGPGAGLLRSSSSGGVSSNGGQNSPNGSGGPNDVFNEIPMCGFLSVRYYQPYFDVDTSDVLTRAKNSVLFFRQTDTFFALIGDKPDLYGPFWIATTLVFILGFTSHVNSFLTSWFDGSAWSYNFQSVLTAASLIYSFTAFVPLCIYLIFRHYLQDQTMGFVKLICLYGYSMFVYLPATVVLLYPFPYLPWISLSVATVLSGMFLLRNLGPSIVNHAKNEMYFAIGLIGAIQFSLLLCLKLYFFYDV